MASAILSSPQIGTMWEEQVMGALCARLFHDPKKICRRATMQDRNQDSEWNADVERPTYPAELECSP